MDNCCSYVCNTTLSAVSPYIDSNISSITFLVSRQLTLMLAVSATSCCAVCPSITFLCVCVCVCVCLFAFVTSGLGFTPSELSSQLYCYSSRLGMYCSAELAHVPSSVRHLTYKNSLIFDTVSGLVGEIISIFSMRYGL